MSKEYYNLRVGKISKDSTKTIIIRGNNDKCEHIKILINSIGTLLVDQSCPTLCNPMDCSPSGSSVHGDFPSKNTGAGCHFLLQGISPPPRVEPRSPPLQADSLPSEPPGKPCGNKSTPKKSKSWAGRGKYYKMFYKLPVPKVFKKKNLKDLQEKKKKREGCKRIFVWLEWGNIKDFRR